MKITIKNIIIGISVLSGVTGILSFIFDWWEKIYKAFCGICEFFFSDTIEILMIFFIPLIALSILAVILLFLHLKSKDAEEEVIIRKVKKEEFWNLFKTYYDPNKEIDWKIQYNGKRVHDIHPFCRECQVDIILRASQAGREVVRHYFCTLCDKEFNFDSRIEGYKSKVTAKIRSIINKGEWQEYLEKEPPISFLE